MAGVDILGTLDANFNRREVSIIEFAESRKYCGKSLYPRQKLLLKLFFLEELTDQEEAILDTWMKGGAYGSEITIAPGIRERTQWLKEHGYKHFREIVLVGGRRCSKGFVTGLAMAKLMFDVLQLQDPADHYGIIDNKEIYFSCVATSQDQAKKFQYADFAGAVNSCVAMGTYIKKVQELEFSVRTASDLRQLEEWKRQGRTVVRDTAKLRGNALPANAASLRGSTTMACVMDEFAHFLQGDSAQSDSEVYEAVLPSIAQFGLDGMLFCNSSPFSKVGKFHERFEVGMALDDGRPETPEVLSVQFPSWALFEGWWEDDSYTGPKKCITVSPDWDESLRKKDGTFFYVAADRAAIIQMRSEERQNPEKFKVERRGQFAETIDAYLIPERVDQMYSGCPTRDGQGYLALHTNETDSTYTKQYIAHLDPASTTAGFGFALGHTEILDVGGVQSEHVIFDIIRRWHPQDFSEGVIDYERVIQDVIRYVDIFRPRHLTMDQFNSAALLSSMRKELRSRGIAETHVSEKVATAQGNWNRAETFKTALYMGLVHAPFDREDTRWSAEELKFLQEIKTGRIPRVEKQDVGPVKTKDMADCIMVVVETLIGDKLASLARTDLAAPIVVTSQHGYPIGGYDQGPRRGLDQARRGANPFSALYQREGPRQRSWGVRVPGRQQPRRRGR